MIADGISALVVVLAVALGWRSGAIRQVTRLVAVVAMIVGVPFVSPWIRELIFEESGRASPGVEIGSMLVAGFVIYVTVALAGYVMARMMHWMSSILGFLDRLGGATMGVVVGGLMVYFLAVGMVFMESDLEEWDPENRYHLQGGTVMELAAEHNVLGPWQFPDLKRLHGALLVGEQAHEQGGEALIREDAEAAKVLRDERVQELLGDNSYMEQVRAERYPITLSDGRTREVLNDPGLAKALSAVDWRDIQERLDER